MQQTDSCQEGEERTGGKKVHNPQTQQCGEGQTKGWGRGLGEWAKGQEEMGTSIMSTIKIK